MLQDGPYSFVFFSSDRGEPPHIHVKRDRQIAKFWLEPISLAKNRGFADHELRQIERLVTAITRNCLRRGMTTLELEQDPAAVLVETTMDRLIVHLADGRILSVPLDWSPRLLHATDAERAHW